MTLMYFTATWCQPCKVFGPVMDEIGKTFAVHKLDIEQAPELVDNHGIMSVPTVVLFGDDGLEKSRIVGARTKDMVLDWIEENK